MDLNRKRLIYYAVCFLVSLILQTIKATDTFVIGGIFGILVITFDDLFDKKVN